MNESTQNNYNFVQVGDAVCTIRDIMVQVEDRRITIPSGSIMYVLATLAYDDFVGGLSSKRVGLCGNETHNKPCAIAYWADQGGEDLELIHTVLYPEDATAIQIPQVITTIGQFAQALDTIGATHRITVDSTVDLNFPIIPMTLELDNVTGTAKLTVTGSAEADIPKTSASIHRIYVPSNSIVGARCIQEPDEE